MFLMNHVCPHRLRTFDAEAECHPLFVIPAYLLFFLIVEPFKCDQEDKPPETGALPRETLGQALMNLAVHLPWPFPTQRFKVVARPNCLTLLRT